MQKGNYYICCDGLSPTFTKCNAIEMTICFHTVDGVIRIEIKHVFGMITSY